MEAVNSVLDAARCQRFFVSLIMDATSTVSVINSAVKLIVNFQWSNSSAF